MQVYPIFLNDLGGRRCVVIGSGLEAERKIQGLLACQAAVSLVGADPEFDVSKYDVEWHRRDYQEGDLCGAFLAIVTYVDPVRTRPIWEEAQRERVLINAMDDVPHCTFVAGSILQRGKLTVAISTSGAAPALAVRLRQRLEAELGPEYAIFLEWMARLRAPMSAHFPSFERRRERWYALIDAGIPELLAADDYDLAISRVAELVGSGVADILMDASIPGPGTDVSDKTPMGRHP